MPVITGYLELIPPPLKDATAGKAISVLTMAISAALFLSVFWFRDRLAGMKAMRYSWVAIGLGTCFLVHYLVLRHLSPADAAANVSPNGWQVELAVLLYFLGFVSVLGGVSGVFVCGFIQTRARLHSLADLLPQLEPHQWQDLWDFARTLVSLNKDIQDKKIKQESKVALQRSHAHILGEYKRVLSLLEGGTLEIRGPAMDELYQYFLDGVQDRFRALSLDDIEYWSDDTASDAYLSANRRLISERGKSVERIFIIDPAKGITSKNLEAISKQISIGVHVRIATLDKVREVGPLHDLDFGLFDSFAVSSWRFSDHQTRLFQVMTSRRDIERHERLFKEVTSRCESIPDLGNTAKRPASGELIPRFFDEESLRAWAKIRFPVYDTVSLKAVDGRAAP